MATSSGIGSLVTLSKYHKARHLVVCRIIVGGLRTPKGGSVQSEFCENHAGKLDVCEAFSQDRRPKRLLAVSATLTDIVHGHAPVPAHNRGEAPFLSMSGP